MKRSFGLFSAPAMIAAGLLSAGCGTNSPTTMTCDPAKEAPHQFAVNKLLVPAVKTDYSIDLNGDGRPDNQLGNILGALASQGLDPQTSIDTAVLNGQALVLVSVNTCDATLQSDSAVTTTLYLGKSMANPDFGGMGMFTTDTSQAPAAFSGALTGGVYESDNPVTTHSPVSMTLSLPLISGSPPVSLKINGAYVKFTGSATGLMKGQLDGSIKNSDIQTSIIPAVAMLLTGKIMATDLGQMCTMNSDCKSSGMCTMSKCVLGDTAKQIKMIFDVGDSNGGNCTNPDGTMGKPNDGKIDICEVSGNQLIANLLVPDVQIYAADGTTYMPNKANTMKDSLSLGLGFTAVGAKF